MITKEEINRLSRVRTEKGLKRIFPETKFLYSKLAICFYKIKDKHWVRCSYWMKDGKTTTESWRQMHTDNVDYNHISVECVYTGNEKKGNYRDLWSRKPVKVMNDGIYVPSTETNLFKDKLK